MRRLLLLLVLVLAVTPVAEASYKPSRMPESVRQVFPAPSQWLAGCIAWYESRNKRFALGSARERGYFQIHPVHFHSVVSRGTKYAMYVNPKWLFLARYNTRVAFALSKGGASWRPWTTLRHC